MADLPNPQRRRHPTNPSLLLPKVFIAYPHKPTPYTQLGPPPAGASPEQIAEAVFRHGKAEEEEIRKHKEKVKAFADFLQKNCVAVAYDRLLEDAGSDNIVRWCQSQIETSDYLILIITPSFKPFLGKKGCPPDKEHVFHSDFLYNLIHGSCPEHTEIVPVFLQCPKDLNHLPVALHTSTIYEVWGAYTQPFEPDLEALYCRLTKQNRYQPPEPLKAPIVIEPRRGPCK